MHQLSHLIHRSRRQQHGITLIESLVAIVITAVGVLGVLTVQMRTLSETQTSVHRAQAIRLIEDLSERMKVSPNALLGLKDYEAGYSEKSSTLTAAKNCSTTICDPAAQSAYDLKQWKSAVEASLPGGQASIFLAPGETADANRRQVGVMVAWNEKEPDTTTAYKNPIDATKIVSTTDGTLVAGTDVTNACPTDKTCHLQYIAVAARCAPYDNGSGTKTFYCS